MLALRPTDVDLPNRVWRIPAEMNKSGKPVAVTLCPETVDILCRRVAAPENDPFVFPGRQPGTHMQMPRPPWN